MPSPVGWGVTFGGFPLSGIARTIAPVLTPRELEVLILTADGLTAKQIGERLEISFRTARTHQWNLQKKLGARGLVNALALAYARGLVTLVQHPT